MRNRILLFSAVVLGLGVTCTYLFIEVKKAHQQLRQAEDQIPQLQARIKALKVERLSRSDVGTHPEGGAPQAQVASGGSPARSTSNTQTNTADASAAKNEEILRMLRDPGSRALLRAEEIAKLKAQNPELQRALALTDDMYQKLLELRAEQNLQFREIAPTGTAAEADIGRISEMRRRQRGQLAASLGEEGLKAYDKYMAGTLDRAEVRQLRTLLSAADQLTDEQATSLISSLREERAQYTQEFRAQEGGSGMFPIFTGDGIAFVRAGTGSAPSSSAGDDESREKQLFDQLESYKKRIVNRASTVLNHEQLKAFEEMQERQVAAVQVSLRQARQSRAAVAQ